MDELVFYTNHSQVTHPHEYAHHFDPLPDDVEGIARVVQGLIYHYFADQYMLNCPVPVDRLGEIENRTIPKMLKRIFEMDDRPLADARPPEKRVLGCCRDFTVLFTAIARHKGIPTRARYGFATYFDKDFYTDHVVAEYWDGHIWKLIDAQLGPIPIEKLGIDFDVTDVPRDRFVVGGRALQIAEAGEVPPDRFGVTPQMEFPRGLGYIFNHILQDLAGLNKVEALCWENWSYGLQEPPLPEADMALLNYVAEVTTEPHPDFPKLRDLYDDERLKAKEVLNFSPSLPRGQIPVKITL